MDTILLAFIAGTLLIQVIFDKSTLEAVWWQTFLCIAIASAILLVIALAVHSLLGTPTPNY